MNIGVVGAGSWGTALAYLLDKNGHNVTIWGFNKDEVEALNNDRENKKFLPGVKLSDNLKVTNIDEDLKDMEMIILAVPSKAVREISERFKNTFNDGRIIVNVAKGLEEGTLFRLSQVIQEVIPNSKVAVLSGPSHAEEVGKDMATACVASAYDIEVAKKVQDVFMSVTFRVYTNMDIIGVELGGALKNLIALAAGASDGCGFGDNTKSALMTRGMTEIARLGMAMGAKRETFSGLTGIGDLIVTCTSMHSRNRRAGMLLGQGKTLEETLDEIKMVVEGVNTAKAAYDLSKKYNVDMPITTEINEVLYNNKNTRDAVITLMTRNKTDEQEEPNLLA
ncbi:NAD(P)H-dependent glycerol-3-phosphate dehydrogenase [[Clostridium] colinum]|uniref:NAD(P)H-dependent glycerol-3-phosphate dehydrogenase n=1 Tax=[Clostridium] colinum TaxID=36835 RepID=UPI00202490B5|nr:NAD(P)H-dependent glycerol-3-phosphate dehydrogenase [[Clostridium] colinum]